jgi:LysM repeat protein
MSRELISVLQNISHDPATLTLALFQPWFLPHSICIFLKMHAAHIHLLLLGLLSNLGLDLVSAGRLRPVIARRGVTCYFDTQAEAGETCDNMSASWGISVEEFTKLNPGLTCPNLQAGKSYCVVGEYTDDGGQTTLPPSPTATSARPTTPPASTIRTSTIRTSTIRTSTSTTTPPNPSNSPAMPGIVENCDRFHKVQSGDGCDSIAQKNGITTAQFKSWNTEINASCSNLWLDYYVCVRVPGATTPPTTTTTGPSPSNSPLMPGVVGNCNRFHKVQSGDGCDSIAQKSGISNAQLKSWNTEINASCSNLWLDYYICIGVPGSVPTTPPPTPSNSPALPGAVSNCNKWYKIRSGDSCDNVAAKNTITVAQLRRFNTQINSSMYPQHSPHLSLTH